MKKAIAVFDIDGTVLRGTSTERTFARFLLLKRELSLANGFSCFQHFLTMFSQNWIIATKGNRFYLKGKEKEHIEKLAEECFYSRVVPRISGSAQAIIEMHKNNGLEIVLLSGTPDFLLRHFQEYLGADHAIGSTLQVWEGRYTGELHGPFPYGQVKAEIVRTHYGCDPYDLSASYAYADRISDFDFLKLFGHPTIVNPNPPLATKAKQVGIDIAFL